MVFGYSFDVIKLLNRVGADVPPRPVLNVALVLVVLFPLLVLWQSRLLQQTSKGLRQFTLFIVCYAIALLGFYAYVYFRVKRTLAKYSLRDAH